MVTTRAENRRINEIDHELADRKREIKRLEQLDWADFSDDESVEYNRHHAARLSLLHEKQGIQAAAQNRISDRHRQLNVHLSGRGRQVVARLSNPKLLECLGYLSGERTTEVLRTTSRASRALYIEEVIRRT